MLRVSEIAPEADAAGARTPPDTIVYAVGDIHGRSDLLEEMQRGIAAHTALRSAKRKLIVYLGDYVSRGINARAVVDLVRLHRPRGFEIVALKGNHEDLLLRFLDGDLDAGRHWFEYDGLDTLAHYGLQFEIGRGFDALRAVFREALPPEHLAFFRSLLVSHTEGDYRFVHAGVLPSVPLRVQTDHDQMWIRRPFLESVLDHGAVIVHGHCVTPEPQVRRNRIGIDTGAYKSGILTCVVLEGAARAFLQTVPGRVDG